MKNNFQLLISNRIIYSSCFWPQKRGKTLLAESRATRCIAADRGLYPSGIPALRASQYQLPLIAALCSLNALDFQASIRRK